VAISSFIQVSFQLLHVQNVCVCVCVWKSLRGRCPDPSTESTDKVVVSVSGIFHWSCWERSVNVRINTLNECVCLVISTSVQFCLSFSVGSHPCVCVCVCWTAAYLSWNLPCGLLKPFKLRSLWAESLCNSQLNQS